MDSVFPADANVKHLRHPEIRVRLVGTDGNAFAVLGVVPVRYAMPASATRRSRLSATTRLRVITSTCSRSRWHGWT